MADCDIDAARRWSSSLATEVTSDDVAPMAIVPKAAASATETTGLDQNLWVHLPEVLVQAILQFLPAESVFKFHFVYREWHEILTDCSFLDSHLGAPHQSPFCVLANVVGIDYDPESGSYQILARSTLFHIGGLHNPQPGRAQLHVYDLKANTWDMIYDSSDGAGPEEWDMSYKVLEPAVLHGGFWYYLTHAHCFWDPRTRNATPHVFRVRKGVVEALDAPLPHETAMIVDFLHLFVRQGKLILAGSLKTKDNLILNEWARFQSWMLDEEKSEWVDYLKMPLYLVNYLGDRKMKQFALDLECSMDKDYICF